MYINFNIISCVIISIFHFWIKIKPLNSITCLDRYEVKYIERYLKTSNTCNTLNQFLLQILLNKKYFITNTLEVWKERILNTFQHIFHPIEKNSYIEVQCMLTYFIDIIHCFLIAVWCALHIVLTVTLIPSK